MKEEVTRGKVKHFSRKDLDGVITNPDGIIPHSLDSALSVHTGAQVEVHGLDNGYAYQIQEIYFDPRFNRIVVAIMDEGKAGIPEDAVTVTRTITVTKTMPRSAYSDSDGSIMTVDEIRAYEEDMTDEEQYLSLVSLVETADPGDIKHTVDVKKS